MRVTLESCGSAFKNANMHILRCWSDLGYTSTTDAWKSIFGIRPYEVEKAPGAFIWEALDFRDQEHFIEWYLRWA